MEFLDSDEKDESAGTTVIEENLTGIQSPNEIVFIFKYLYVEKWAGVVQWWCEGVRVKG